MLRTHAFLLTSLTLGACSTGGNPAETGDGVNAAGTGTSPNGTAGSAPTTTGSAGGMPGSTTGSTAGTNPGSGGTGAGGTQPTTPTAGGGGAPISGAGPVGNLGGSAAMAGTSADDGGAAGESAAGAGGSAPVGGGGAGPTVECETPEEEAFSFFLISQEALQRISDNEDGFGGDFGGLAGADEICRQAAITASSCAGNKTWRAFLSSPEEDAIDRIGTGPWMDRLGRLVSNNLEDLVMERPGGADPAIINDLPNEYGIPNHNPDGMGEVDNHQTLTGSGADGRLYTQEPEEGGEGGGGGGGPGGGFQGGTACPGGFDTDKATCWGWTSAEPEGCPRVGHSWPRQGFGLNWITFWNEGGCAPGGTLDDSGGPNGDPTVGSAGGYGGYYCFAFTP